jgi:hypothetical protein
VVSRLKRGRAIALRKPRKRQALRRGEAPVIAQLDLVAARLGWDHPIVREVIQTLLGISRGAVGYRGRHVGVRLSATRELLDRILGTPGEAGGGGGDDGALGELMRRIDAGEFEPKL